MTIDYIYVTEQMKDAGLPVVSVRSDGTFELSPEATAEQIAQAQAIVDGYEAPNETFNEGRRRIIQEGKQYLADNPAVEQLYEDTLASVEAQISSLIADVLPLALPGKRAQLVKLLMGLAVPTRLYVYDTTTRRTSEVD